MRDSSLSPWRSGRATDPRSSDAVLASSVSSPREPSSEPVDTEIPGKSHRPVKPGAASSVHNLISKVLKGLGIYTLRDTAYVSLVNELAVVPPGGEGLLLDIGCGHGRIISRMRGDCRLLGIDLKQRRLVTFVDPSIPRLRGDAERLPVRGRSVDVLLALSLVEHLPDQPAFFEEVSRVLADGGMGILQIPNLRYPIEPHTKWPLLFMWNESVRSAVLSATGCTNLDLSTSVDSVIRMATDAGLSVDQVLPLWHLKIARLFRVPMGHFLVIHKKSRVGPLAGAEEAAPALDRRTGVPG